MEEERNGIIRRYVINITELNSGTEYQLENTSTEITVQNLHPFYQYSYSVAAETVALGPFTPSAIIEMPEDGKLTGAYGKAGNGKEMKLETETKNWKHKLENGNGMETQ